MSGGGGEYQGFGSDVEDYLSSFCPFGTRPELWPRSILDSLFCHKNYLGCVLLGVSSRISSGCALPIRLCLCRSALSSFTGALLLTSFYATEASTDAKSTFFTIDSRLQTLGGPRGISSKGVMGAWLLICEDRDVQR